MNLRYDSSPRTYNSGDLVDGAATVNGALQVAVVAGGSSTAQGTYNATAPTLTDGQTASTQLDQRGNLKTSLGTLLAGEDLVNNWTRVNTTNASQQTLFASAARTASANGTQLAVGNYREAIVTLNCTAASGTTPTLNVKIQASDDGGTTWYDLPSAAFTQLTATGSQAIQIDKFGDTIRAVATIAGTTPSFTFATKVVLK